MFCSQTEYVISSVNVRSIAWSIFRAYALDFKVIPADSVDVNFASKRTTFFQLTANKVLPHLVYCRLYYQFSKDQKRAQVYSQSYSVFARKNMFLIDYLIV